MKLRFYFDCISPNAWFAWHGLPALVAGTDFTVEPIPILLGAVLDACGQGGPAESPARTRWVIGNVPRKAKPLNMPLARRHPQPSDPLRLVRASGVR